jgi:hypothetical protein
LAVSAAGTANANMIIFDGNNGGTAKSGTVATGSGLGTTGTGDVFGDPLSFSGFDVEAGFSTSTNLADSSFDTSEIDYSSFVYQDLTPSHGGLGAFSNEANDAFKGDTDNLESNLITGATGDEVLFFNFDSAVVLDQVWFNGSHQENVAFNDNGSFDPEDSLWNIFFSEDGATYTSVFGGGQQSPTEQEFLFTGLTSAYSYFAVAATGWNSATGGYVEAIKYSSVPEPGTLALFALGLGGLVASRKRNGLTRKA